MYDIVLDKKYRVKTKGIGCFVLLLSIGLVNIFNDLNLV